jgi:hypothetical protein
MLSKKKELASSKPCRNSKANSLELLSKSFLQNKMQHLLKLQQLRSDFFSRKLFVFDENLHKKNLFVYLNDVRDKILNPTTISCIFSFLVLILDEEILIFLILLLYYQKSY